MMSKFHTGGHISVNATSEVEILYRELVKAKDFIWMGGPEYEEVYQNWNNYLEFFNPKGDTNQKYKIGKVSENLVSRLLKSLKSIPQVPYDKFDCKSNYVPSRIKPTEAVLWTRFLKYFDFKEEQLALVKLICQELKPDIENYLDAPFKLINVKSFETLPGAAHFGPNKVHTDSLYPTHTYKVFLYLTPPNLDDGTTMIYPKDGGPKKVHMHGPAGTYLLFNPVYMHHEGIPPKLKPRAMLELILVPSYETEINPTFNGTNSTCPVKP